MLNKLLRLERNLGVLDIETTGLDFEKDRIVQLALTIHYPHRDSIAWNTLVNPGVPILNSDIHGITNADVDTAPTFEQIAPALAPKMINIDIAGYYVEFDIAFMRAAFNRARVEWPWNGHVIDACAIFKRKEPHNLGNAYKRFVNQDGFKGAHDARNDVPATEEVLEAQLNEYQDLPRTVKELSEWCFPRKANSLDKDGKFTWVDDEVIISFGKRYNGVLLRKVPRDYLEWILRSEFTPEVKKICSDAIAGVYPVKE